MKTQVSVLRKQILPKAQKATNLIPEGQQESISAENKSAEPVNAYVIQRSKEFTDNMGGPLAARIIVLQEFLLNEIFPLGLAFYNATQNAEEVIKSSLGTDPELRAFIQKAESYLDQALRVKISTFLSSFCSLSETENAQYLLRVLNSDTSLPNERLTTLLSEMLKIPDVPGQAEGAGSQVREVQRTKRNLRRK